MTRARFDLGDGAWTEYDPGFLDPVEADALFEALLHGQDWVQIAIRVFDREVLQPRLSAWAGTLEYHYSGQTLPARAPVEPVGALLDRVNAALHARFNHALLNLYRDGTDKIALHADNEPELGRDPLIAAISLGAARRFELVPKDKRRRRKDRRRLRLDHGSLLVMGGTVQHRWRHAVPAQPEVQEPRINLTFRTLLGPPGYRPWRDATPSPATQ